MYSTFAHCCHNIALSRYACDAFSTTMLDLFQNDADCLILGEITKENWINDTADQSVNWRFLNYAQSLSGADDNGIYTYGPSRSWAGTPYGGHECPLEEYNKITDANNPQGLVLDLINGPTRSINTQTMIGTLHLTRTTNWSHPLFKLYHDFRYSTAIGDSWEQVASAIYARDTNSNSSRLRLYNGGFGNEILGTTYYDLSAPLLFIIESQAIGDPFRSGGNSYQRTNTDFWINGVHEFSSDVDQRVNNNVTPTSFIEWRYNRAAGGGEYNVVGGDTLEPGIICFLERSTTSAERDRIFSAWANNFDPPKSI